MNSNEAGLRADARRNRARILEVARSVFAEKGMSVPVDEVAQRAGVGIGTVYRHFPTKEDLFKAVIVSHKQQLIEEAKALAEKADAGQAFFHFFSRVVEEGDVSKAFADALAGAGLDTEDIHCLFAEISQEFRSALGLLLSRAQQRGKVRSDVTITDVTALMFGILRAVEQYGGDAAMRERLVSIASDGLSSNPS
jgi:AcrR family transcriptional regulator